MKVGFYMKSGKWEKMNMAHFVETARSKGIEVIRIDLSKDLDSQGPFDIIIHKSIDLFVQSSEHFKNEKAKLQLEHFIQFHRNHPEIPIFNPFAFDELVISRRKTFDELAKLDFKNDCFVPDLSIKTGKYVIKTDLACGAETAHKFEFIESDNPEKIPKSDSFVQPYFETNNAVLKVYGIGEYTKVNVKKPDNYELQFDFESVERIAKEIRNHLGCELFGFDLVKDIISGKWYIIDLNSFSGIEVIPGFEEMMIDFFFRKIKK